jgi:ligand-binding SRPBCC domain-containing protein
MPDLHFETEIAAPPEVCFDLERDVDVHQASTAGSVERAISGVTSGKMQLGDEVTWEARHFGLRFHMTSKITAFDRPHNFTDQMQRGPFGHWHHSHRFEARDGGTLMVDDVDFASPFGPLGSLVDAIYLHRYMANLLIGRNRHIKRIAEELR